MEARRLVVLRDHALSMSSSPPAQRSRSGLSEQRYLSLAPRQQALALYSTDVAPEEHLRRHFLPSVGKHLRQSRRTKIIVKAHERIELVLVG